MLRLSSRYDSSNKYLSQFCRNIQRFNLLVEGVAEIVVGEGFDVDVVVFLAITVGTKEELINKNYCNLETCLFRTLLLWMNLQKKEIDTSDLSYKQRCKRLLFCIPKTTPRTTPRITTPPIAAAAIKTFARVERLEACFAALEEEESKQINGKRPGCALTLVPPVLLQQSAQC